MATVNGTNGNDRRVLGTRGNDTINGLRGNDLLEGGQGRDTYVFDRNFGRDIVSDDDGSSGSNPGDAVYFRADRLSDVRSARVTGGGNLVITTRNGTVNIRDFRSNRHGIETIRFSDTTAFWDGRRLVAGDGRANSNRGRGNDGDDSRRPRGPRTVSIDNIRKPSLNNPNGTTIDVTLKARPIPGTPNNAYHGFIEYRDRRTGEKRIIDAGPKGNPALSDLIAVDVPASQSDEDERRGQITVDRVTIKADFDAFSNYNKRVANRLSGAGITYGIVTDNSNATAGDFFELAAGRAPRNPPRGKPMPGLRGTVITGGRSRRGGNNNGNGNDNRPRQIGGNEGATREGDAGDGTRGNSCTGTCRNGGSGNSNSERSDRQSGNRGGLGGERSGDFGDGLRGPVVLDLDRDGALDLVSNDSGGWVGPSDGFLAIDADGSGAVDQANEIEFTKWHDDARTDLEGLALAFDSNGDSVVDGRDERFTEFKVFQDIDGNGVSGPGELMSLEEAGIMSIDLSGVPYEGEPSVIQEKAGNQVFGVTTVAYDDGSFGIAGDVALGSDQMSVAESSEAGAPGDAIEQLTADVASLASTVDKLVNAIAAMPAQEGYSWRRNGQIDHPTPTQPLLAA